MKRGRERDSFRLLLVATTVETSRQPAGSVTAGFCLRANRISFALEDFFIYYSDTRRQFASHADLQLSSQLLSCGGILHKYESPGVTGVGRFAQT